MLIYDDEILIYLEDTVVDLADTDTSNVFVVVDGADKHLHTCIRITCRGRNVINDSVEQRLHVCARLG